MQISNVKVVHWGDGSAANAKLGGAVDRRRPHYGQTTYQRSQFSLEDCLRLQSGAIYHPVQIQGDRVLFQTEPLTYVKLSEAQHIEYLNYKNFLKVQARLP